MAGLLDGLFGSTPQAPTATPLDAGSQGILNSQVATAEQTPQQIQSSLAQNVGSAQGLMGTPQQQTQKEASLGGDYAGSGALKNAYASTAAKGVNDVYKNTLNQAKLQKADYMNQTAKALLGQQQQKVSNFQTLTDAYNQQEASRAGFISSLFGLGNAAIAINAASPKTSTSGNAVQNQAGQNTQFNLGVGAQPLSPGWQNLSVGGQGGTDYFGPTTSWPQSGTRG